VTARTVPTSTEATAAFLTAYYGSHAPGHVVLFTRAPTQVLWCPAGDLDAVAAEVHRHAATADVNFGLALQDMKAAVTEAQRRVNERASGTGKRARTLHAEDTRGFASTALALAGVWVEIDVADPVHKQHDLPPTIDDALALLAECPLAPTVLIHSGHGLHGHWLFPELWRLGHVDHSAEQRADAARLVEQWQAAWRALAGAHGWRVDATHDLARVLRLPGTWNHRGAEPLPVRLLTWEPDRRYTRAQLAAWARQWAGADTAGASPNGQTHERPHTPRTDTARDRVLIAAIGAAWPQSDEERQRVSRHDHILRPLAGALIRRTSPRHAQTLMCAGVKRSADSTRDWDGEIARLVENAADKWVKDRQVEGLPRLSERCPELAAVVAALWPPLTMDGDNCSFARSFADESPENAAPLYPCDTLPEPCRRFVEDGARALGAPPDLIAPGLLAFAGAALGNRHSLELKAGYQQRAGLYVGKIAPPGMVKSPALELARYPLDVAQRAAAERFHTRLEAYEADLQRWENTKRSERGEKPVRPLMEHFYTTNATIEALAPMLAQSAGVALIQDELVAWVKSHDAYRGGRGGDRQQYLSAWAGAAMKVDRKGGDPLFVPWPTLSVVGGIQPELLPDLADEAGRRDGFIERILWCWPDVAPATWTEDEVAAESKDAVAALFRQLRAGTSDRPVRLGDLARARWVRWYDDNARLTAGLAGIGQGIAAKMPNQLARLVLILHCLQHADVPAAERVALATMDAAIELAEYHRAHAQRVLPRFRAAPSTGSAGLYERVLRILDAANGAWVNRRTLHQKLHGNVAAADLTAMLERLAAEGQAEQEQIPTGHRPAECWRRTSRTNEQTNKYPGGAVPDDGMGGVA
jgi:hypothetical protein